MDEKFLFVLHVLWYRNCDALFFFEILILFHACSILNYEQNLYHMDGHLPLVKPVKQENVNF